MSQNSLIISSPFECPTYHWERNPQNSQLDLKQGRRPASYEIFDTRSNTLRSVELELVNRIRQRVNEWREADYPGITAITRQLLTHWYDKETTRPYEFYFCQIEAIETLIWHVEATPEFKQGIAIQGDGGEWERLCNKMATGSGKTTVMSMIITWQVLNAITYPKRHKDFSKAIFIVAPGLTVKERLQILMPGHPQNYYDDFSLCPNEVLRQKLNQAEILIENWHSLMPQKEPERSVVKKGKESDEAYVRRVLGSLANHKNIVIINDEAHHAYRKPAEVKISKKDAEEFGIDLDEATRWVEGLDRIHKVRGIIRCFDLSATPFAPTGKKTTESALFEWVISDFGLYDAIEAGLVKTPRIVVRDSALPSTKDLKPKLYHLYREEEVREDLNRKADPHEALPQIVQQAYTLLGADWREAMMAWEKAGMTSPPVMLTVCNRTETAARIEHYFNKGDALWAELQAPERTLRVDSKVLDKAEKGEKGDSDVAYEARLKEIVEAINLPQDKKQELLALKKEDLLRAIVDNVGKRGTAGQNLQNVISVAMLSEGWDAKNVTHIMGLRAFSSQLLCEQVIGRGLRRVGYDTQPVECPDGIVRDLFAPEYVNIFGVPLSIFQDVGEGGTNPQPPKPTTQISTLAERSAFEITWANVLRVDSVLKEKLVVDWDKVPSVELDPSEIHVSADLAPALGGATDLSKAVGIDLESLPEEFRMQKLLFIAARKAFENVQQGYTGSKEILIQQLIRLSEEFLKSDKIHIPSLFHQEPLKKRILIALSMDKVVQHLVTYVHQANVTVLEPIFDLDKPIGSTADMRTWYTTRLCQPTEYSQISHVVADGSWEAYAANVLEKFGRDKVISSYAKNDHLGFNIYYMWNGSKRKYVPDFLIRLANGKSLVLEIKGQDSDQNKAKRIALDMWVKAVNQKGGFGTWCWDVVKEEPSRMHDVIIEHSKFATYSKPIGELYLDL